MSEASESAHVRIVLADYAVGDSSGKMTLVGAGISIFGMNAETRLTAPFGVWVYATFAPRFTGTDTTVELSLETENGDLVKVPFKQDGKELERPLRVRHTEALRTTTVPNADVPGRMIRPKTQVLLNLQSGIKVDAGRLYIWRVRIDGETRDDWTEPMFVPTASAPTAFG